MTASDLHRAVRRNDAAGCSDLLARGAPIDARAADGRTALMQAAQDGDVDVAILELLLQHGASVDLLSTGLYTEEWSVMAFALAGGDPRKVRALLAAGASLHYRRGGYDALLDAVHHRAVERDPNLLELIDLLIDAGVELSTVSPYGESGLRVLSRIGRFDAVKRLLEAGAAAAQLAFTPLLRAVALEPASEVQRLLEMGASTEERDFWSRTPWLVAILSGDLAKEQLLREHGADPDARGRGEATPLSYAVGSGNPAMLQALIASGQDVDQQDDLGGTALSDAVVHDDLACVDLLLARGADVEHRNQVGETALKEVRSAPLARRLLEAGADPAQLGQDGRRALIGLSPETDPAALEEVSKEEFSRARTRRFGSRNPEPIDEPFWLAMIRAGVSAHEATATFSELPLDDEPVWCAERFGQSLTFLPDGRIVQIGGEHEDAYDPDFCIYNDVFVHGPDGQITIHAYPESVFPPTDFHTATLVGTHVYVVGSLGYLGKRAYGAAPVYRLDTKSLAFEKVDCTGSGPGWIHRHVAISISEHEIEIRGGIVLSADSDRDAEAPNERTFVLDTRSHTWRESSPGHQISR